MSAANSLEQLDIPSSVSITLSSDLTHDLETQITALIQGLIKTQEAFKARPPQCILDPISVPLMPTGAGAGARAGAGTRVSTQIEIRTQRLTITKKKAMSAANFSLFLRQLWEALDQSGILFNQSLNMGSLPFPFESILISHIPVIQPSHKKEKVLARKEKIEFCISPFMRLNTQASRAFENEGSSEGAGSLGLEPENYLFAFPLEDLKNLKISWFKYHQQNDLIIEQIQGILGALKEQVLNILHPEKSDLELDLDLDPDLDPDPDPESNTMSEKALDALFAAQEKPPGFADHYTKFLDTQRWSLNLDKHPERTDEEESLEKILEKHGLLNHYGTMGRFSDVERLERGLMDLTEFQSWLEIRLEIHTNSADFSALPPAEQIAREANSYRLINGFLSFEAHDYLQVEEFKRFLAGHGITQQSFLEALETTHQRFSQAAADTDGDTGADTAADYSLDQEARRADMQQRSSDGEGVEEAKEGSIDGPARGFHAAAHAEAESLTLEPTSSEADAMALFFCEHLLTSSPAQAARSEDTYLNFGQIARAIDQEIARQSAALSGFTREDFESLKIISQKPLGNTRKIHFQEPKILKQALLKIKASQGSNYKSTLFSKEEIETLKFFLIQVNKADLSAQLPTFLLEHCLNWAEKLNTFRQNLIKANQEISRRLVQEAIDHAKIYRGATCSAVKKAIFQHQLSLPLQRILNEANSWSEDSLEKAIGTVTSFLRFSPELSERRFFTCFQTRRSPTKSFKITEQIASLFALRVNPPELTRAPAPPSADNSTPLLTAVMPPAREERLSTKDPLMLPPGSSTGL